MTWGASRLLGHQTGKPLPAVGCIREVFLPAVDVRLLASCRRNGHLRVIGCAHTSSDIPDLAKQDRRAAKRIAHCALPSDGTNTYTWNARNQLGAVGAATSASFAYDGNGRRRSKTIAGTTTRFLYDGLNFIQEQSSGGTPTANLLTGLGIDETFTRADGNGTSTLLADALGSPLELADTSGTLQTHYTYGPFGEATVSGAATSNASAFTGREADETGMMFYRARYYDPLRQRFLSEDPIGFAGGDTNLHAYVSNTPTTWRDPRGLQIVVPLPANSPCAPPPSRKEDTAWRRFLRLLCVQALPLNLPLIAPGSNIPPLLPPHIPIPHSPGDPDAPYGSTPRGRPYTQHYGEESGPERNIPGSVIDNTIDNNQGVPGRNGTTVYYDPVNDVTVVTGRGGVVTAHRGKP
jgi:RHS repeat-associated protein